MEAEDPGHEELDESMPDPDVVPKGVAVPETPSDKDREAHELTHLPSQPWCSVCVRAKGLTNGISEGQVIQFDYAYLSSVNEKGEQVRMRTLQDTSTDYGTACVIDVKGGGDKYANSSALSFLKELGYTRFRCRTDPEPAIKAMVDAVIKCLSDDRFVEQILPEATICESHASLGALEVAQSSARTNSSVATRRRRSIWVNRWCYSSVRAVACETRHLAVEQISAQTEWCDRVRKSERSVIQKKLMQFGERCHWLEAERITHKYDFWWAMEFGWDDTLHQTHT